MDELAERYVRLALALDQHDPGCVDAYFGPPEWLDQASADPDDLTTIRASAKDLLEELESAGPDRSARFQHLLGQVRAVAARADIVGGRMLAFDEEARVLYGTDVPSYDESHFDHAVAELDELLPAGDTLTERYGSFLDRSVVPPDKVQQLTELAVAECRRRTVERIELPVEETYELTLTRGKAWGGQTIYQGGFRSQILVNLDVPLRIDRILDLAGHEGYPGHHVSGLLMERDLVLAAGWPEFSVLFLFSPAALVAEGTAMLAVEMAFGTTGRVAYERDVLYPAAGLDPTDAERADHVQQLARQSAFAVNQIARRYLDGSVTAPDAQSWLVRYALMTPQQAEQRVRFIDRYRSYVINYTVGEQLVRSHLDRTAGTPDQSDHRWQVFTELLRFPMIGAQGDEDPAHLTP